MQSTAAPCRNNPPAGIMPVIPLTELPASLRHPNASGLVSRRDRCRAAASGAFHLPRSYLRARHLLVSLGLSGADGRGRPPARPALGGQAMKRSSNLAALIERYFTVRLMQQRNVSTNTIASYRDTFRLL